jgi:hypothetical protein
MGRLSADDPNSVKIDSNVELVIEPLYHEEDGTAVTTWKFKEV